VELGQDREIAFDGLGVLDGWDRGEETLGWAMYWADIYGYVADQLEQDDKLRAATIIVRYEDLCADPAGQLRGLLEHCDLGTAEDYVASQATRIHPPTYYRADFPEAELELIAEHTEPTARRLGYRP